MITGWSYNGSDMSVCFIGRIRVIVLRQPDGRWCYKLCKTRGTAFETSVPYPTREEAQRAAEIRLRVRELVVQ